jgi:integrase/recombinase XerD
MGNELRNKILEYNGISIESLKKQKPTVSNCPRCELVNPVDNKYCSKCSYPLSPEAFDMIKQDEEKRFVELEKKYTEKLTSMEDKIERLLIKVDLQKLL